MLLWDQSLVFWPFTVLFLRFQATKPQLIILKKDKRDKRILVLFHLKYLANFCVWLWKLKILYEVQWQCCQSYLGNQIINLAVSNQLIRPPVPECKHSLKSHSTFAFTNREKEKSEGLDMFTTGNSVKIKVVSMGVNRHFLLKISAAFAL